MNRYEDIRAWAEARNLIKGGTPQAQLNKLLEEIGEMDHGLDECDVEEVADGIGDSLVVLTIMAAQYGLKVEEMSWNYKFTTLTSLGKLAHGVNKNRPSEVAEAIAFVLSCLHEEAQMMDLIIGDCLEIAWDEIKDRKGIMRDGIFIKEADL